jgi:hypothetical protein
MRPTVEEIRERAVLVARETGMDVKEAEEMLAIATGLAEGCESEDEGSESIAPGAMD